MFVTLIDRYGNITFDGEEYTDASEFEDGHDSESDASDGEIHGHHSEVVHHVGGIHQPQVHSESSDDSGEEDSGVNSNVNSTVPSPPRVDKKFSQLKLSQPQVKGYYRIAFCSDSA